MMQARLWGVGADDWSTIQEPRMEPFFTAILDSLEVAPPARLLDIGCGTGLMCARAAQRGYDVTGLDQSEGFLETAKRRSESISFVQGDLQALPFDEASFDCVVAANSVQFAQHPDVALGEVHRVLRPAGRAIIGIWAPPERSDASLHMRAVAELVPAAQMDGTGPFALSQDGRLKSLMEAAGLCIIGEREVAVRWEYPDEETLLRGVTSSGTTHRARATVGDETVFAIIRNIVARFAQSDGSFVMNNLFKIIVSAKP